MACCRLGCAKVTVTDLPSTLPLLELNLGLNFGFVTAAIIGDDNTPDIQALPLVWGDPISQAVENRVGSLPVQCLLLCDVVYEPMLFPLLLTTMRDLCGTKTIILMAYRRRNPDEHR